MVVTFHSARIAAGVVSVVLAVSACSSLEPRADPQAAVDVPAGWSAADAAPVAAATSLVGVYQKSLSRKMEV